MTTAAEIERAGRELDAWVARPHRGFVVAPHPETSPVLVCTMRHRDDLACYRLLRTELIDTHPALWRKRVATALWTLRRFARGTPGFTPP